MGTNCLGMIEVMAMLKVLAEENIATLKKNYWKDEHDTFQMHDRIKQINDLMKTMNYHWGYIPNEWNTEKKLWLNQKPTGNE